MGDLPQNITPILSKALNYHAASVAMLEKMVYWCTRAKGGVMYQGRLWSFRTQAEWIELAGLRERTGKTVFKRLAAEGYILAEMRIGGPKGNRRKMMHVALADKALTLLGQDPPPSLALPITHAELALKKYEQDAEAQKWEAKKKADIEAAKAAGEWYN